MIITKLAGGLGNQMFQYAIGRVLSLQKNTELKIDLSFLLDRTTPRDKDFVFIEYDLGIFNIEEKFASPDEVKSLKKLFLNSKADTLIKKITGTEKTYFKEPHFHFTPTAFKLGSNIYLDGYWQSSKYFQNYEDVIRKDFTLKKSLSSKSLQLNNLIKTTNSVCVNVRRGDFVTNPIHGTIGIEYYNKAEKIINKNQSGLHFFVFSDDIDWCKKNLKFSETTTYVSHEYAGEKFSEYLELMRSCNHYIIPNSSFGWWAAWLNINPQKIVIAPAKWFGKGSYNAKDILPDTWIKI